LNRIIYAGIELSALVKLIICQQATIDCYLQECVNCNTKIPSDFFIEQLNMNGVNEDDDVTWMIWERNEKRTELQRHTTSISTLIEKFDSLWSKFLIHHYITIEQREYIKKIKIESSDHGTAVVQLDFAENFTLFSQSAVQSSYWSQIQATIFTVHIKMGTGHRNLVFISDYMKHTTEFVYECQTVIVSFIKKWYPNVKHL
jgi:pullulanase/glycogen debranching enzyme